MRLLISCRAIKSLEDLPSGYPSDIPKNFDELSDLWASQELNSASKRLLLLAPDAYPWSEIGEYWENTIHYPSKGWKWAERSRLPPPCLI